VDLRTVQERAAELERQLDAAPDEETARPIAAELHALMDAVENVVELRPSS
jgi:hypothetical protein